MSQTALYYMTVAVKKGNKQYICGDSAKMSRSAKRKASMQNPKINMSLSSLGMTSYERGSIMTNLLNILFEQVRLQQEVRDRWFGHYLTIIGSLTALATLGLKFFEDVVRREVLFIILGIMFEFSCLLGIFFYILYLHQRRNYKQKYDYLSIIQREILKSIAVIPSELYDINTFSTKRHGADFDTLLIQSSIDAAMFAVGIVFLIISQKVILRTAGIFATIGFIVMFVALQFTRYSFER